MYSILKYDFIIFSKNSLCSLLGKKYLNFSSDNYNTSNNNDYKFFI